MRKIKLLSTLAFASTAVVALASCNGVKNENEAKEFLLKDALTSLEQDKIQNITIEAVTALNGHEHDIYVSPSGTKDGDGTKEHPYDFVTATRKVDAGYNIIMMAGTYYNGFMDHKVITDDSLSENEKNALRYAAGVERIPVGKDSNIATAEEIKYNGKPGKFITVQPEQDPFGNYAEVTFDFSDMAFDDGNRGIQVYADYWYFYGINVTGAGDNGMYIAGNHNIVDYCQFYNNRDTGLQLGRGGSSQDTLDKWPGFNLIKNCTSFANYDDLTLGENADGFAAKLTVGHMNIFDGCIAFRNSDDGWDLYAKQDSGNIGTVLLYNCVSFENGFLPFEAQTDTPSTDTGRKYDTQNGDGIGFKLGGSTMTGDVVMKNCLTFNNKYHGVSDNSNPGLLDLSNVTAYNNCIGLNDNGTVSDTRGINYAVNKSNNIDLARTTSSYNNFYGILSYINNQAGYEADGDNVYNADAFRGSTAYSIFQTSYDSGEGELYRSFTTSIDASSYHSAKEDIPYNGGTPYYGMADDDFKDLTPINAICASRDTLNTLLHYHFDFRNEDGSVNMGDKLALSASSDLNTFADGSPIGAVLNKSSMAEYVHPEYYSFLNSDPRMTSDMEKVLSAYMALNPITNVDATFQDFDITNLINGCEITWESSNTDVIQIQNNETVSASFSVESSAHIMVPDETTIVKLTATIRYATATVKKDFNITVYPRKQSLGYLESTGNDVIRVSIYSEYYAPEVYAVDSSSISNTPLDPSLYDLEYKYEYAADGNSNKFFPIDRVYTSSPGIYKVTATAIDKSNTSLKSSYTFKVYVVDPNCSIDFINNESKVVLSADGFAITGNLSNVEGYVKAYVTTTDEGELTPEQIVNKATVQDYKVSTDSVVAQFVADNNATTDVAYYIYYTVVNDNLSNLGEASVYKAVVNTKAITSEDEFTKLARTGSPDSKDYSNTLTIFYLTKDLDYAGKTWDTTTKAKEFSGLFNGNNHTISNITINTTPSTEHYVNVFYKVVNGSIMNVTFDKINFKCTDSSKGKRMGIVGSMKGGFIQNVKITNSSFVGYESVGGLVGQVTGGDTFINRCSLINPEIFFEVTTDTVFDANTTYYRYAYQSTDNTYNYNEIDLKKEGLTGQAIPTGEKATDKIYVLPQNYRISSKNKYQAGLVGNAQIADSATYLNITMTNNYVTGTIGDGNDTGGNTAGILGRCKNDSDKYIVTLNNNYFRGTVISKGQYGAGILGDLDNGLGYINVNNNFSFVRFVYKGQYLDADARFLDSVAKGTYAEVQKYAHKNLNPIIGRATGVNNKLYSCLENYGNWTEYYSKLVNSLSAVYGMQTYDEDEKKIERYRISEQTFKNYLKFDTKVWDIYESSEVFEGVVHTQYDARLR